MLGMMSSNPARISSMMNNRIFPLLGITDWKFKFVSIRPSRETERAETLKAQASAVATLRQEAAITINEAREMLGFPVIKNERANDPFFVSPKLSINTPKDADAESNTDSESDIGLDDLFPNPMDEEDEEEIGDMPKFSDIDSEIAYSSTYEKSRRVC